jgi:serine phosphatase RsbU (regulator of sigma subunit)
MARKSRTPTNAWRELLKKTWQIPLYSVPFGLFFGTMSGASPSRYIGAYLVSMIFAAFISYSLWVVEWFVMPRFKTSEQRSMPTWVDAVAYGGTAMLSSVIAAVLLHFTILPGFMGSGRAILMMVMFSLLFTMLFMGLIYSFHFYQAALDKAKAEQELNMARRIQRSFLLSQFPQRPKLEVHAANISSKEVSGDFYDVVPAGTDAFLVAIADVAGKGVPAALMSSMLQASLRTQAGNVTSVAEILRNINTLVYRSTTVSQFATFFLARLDESSLTLAYSNAGHNFPIVFRKDGSRATLVKGGTVVGVLEAAEFEQDVIQLAPGDRVVLYTDGISEAANTSGEMYGEGRLERLVESLPADLSASELVERILQGVREFLGDEEPGDDMTVLALRVLEPSVIAAAAPVALRA